MIMYQVTMKTKTEVAYIAQVILPIRPSEWHISSKVCRSLEEAQAWVKPYEDGYRHISIEKRDLPTMR